MSKPTVTTRVEEQVTTLTKSPRFGDWLKEEKPSKEGLVHLPGESLIQINPHRDGASISLQPQRRILPILSRPEEANDVTVRIFQECFLATARADLASRLTSGHRSMAPSLDSGS
jgi:hypothetical protein